jgi:hypothetical protein
MGAGEEILRRLEIIEAKVDRLLAAVPSAAASASGDALPDHQLDNAWADKEIKKDPKRYSGPTMVGLRYSQAPAAWHEAQASFLDWKAEQGRKENPVRLNNNGKPWHEADTFEAKICRAWARRNSGRPMPAPAAPGASHGGDFDSGGETPLPF